MEVVLEAEDSVVADSAVVLEVAVAHSEEVVPAGAGRHGSIRHTSAVS